MRQDAVDRMLGEWEVTDPALDGSPLAVVGRLLLCAGQLERAIVAALAPLELSFGDFDVINTLRRRDEPEGTHPSQLASSALITSGAMTARLDRLERAGLIERRPDRDDRRAVRVVLTPGGARLAERALTAVLAADEAFLAPLSPRRRSQLATLLKPLLVG